ncbi:MAG TPA: CYTH domain-containing protein [Gemmatimonadaceae bacterium]|nr:CYTH domain-containing protein [Gemmatimonadaceae bacterium]
MSELSYEIERKYLLRGQPPRTVGAPSLEIDQGYIPGDRIRERIRRARDANNVWYYRTIKMGSGIQRIEIEEEATEAFFQAVWPLTLGRRVRKRRYHVEDNGLLWEIDEFLDRPSLWLAELELTHADEKVEIPDWLAPFVEREVTDDPSYTNRALAR